MVREVGEAFPNTPVPAATAPFEMSSVGHNTKYRLKQVWSFWKKLKLIVPNVHFIVLKILKVA